MQETVLATNIAARCVIAAQFAQFVEITCKLGFVPGQQGKQSPARRYVRAGGGHPVVNKVAILTPITCTSSDTLHSATPQSAINRNRTGSASALNQTIKVSESGFIQI